MALIAVVNVPFFSHVAAAARLTALLVDQGHDVVAWTPSAFAERFRAAGARIEPHDVELLDTPDIVATAAEKTMELAGPLATALLDHDVDLLLHDSRAPWAWVAGEYLGIPRIVVYPMFPVAAPLRTGEGGAKVYDEPISEEGWARYEASTALIRRRFGVEIVDPHAVIHCSAETTITFTTREILGGHPLKEGWRCVGSLLPQVPAKPPGRGPPVVYACFGTSYNTRVELFRAVIEALAGLEVRGVVSTGRGPVTAAELGPLPANVEAHDYVDSRVTLAEAAVHITHCGNNSVNESLMAGVPMVLLPQAYDQFPLAGRVGALGAGLGATESPREIRSAVRLLLATDKAHANARAQRDHLAAFDGAARLAETIDHVLAANALGA